MLMNRRSDRDNIKSQESIDMGCYKVDDDACDSCKRKPILSWTSRDGRDPIDFTETYIQSDEIGTFRLESRRDTPSLKPSRYGMEMSMKEAKDPQERPTIPKTSHA